MHGRCSAASFNCHGLDESRNAPFGQLVHCVLQGWDERLRNQVLLHAGAVTVGIRASIEPRLRGVP